MVWKIGTALAICALTATSVNAQGRVVLIRGARVFDGSRIIDTRDVLFAHGRIVAIGSRLKPLIQADVVDGRGKMLLPGLIDDHVHVFPGAQADRRHSPDRNYLEKRLRR